MFRLSPGFKPAPMAMAEQTAEPKATYGKSSNNPRSIFQADARESWHC